MGVVPLPPGYMVREFRVTDVDAFPGYRDEVAARGLDPDTYIAELAAGGCFTVLKDGVPVGCAGITIPVERQETAWSILGDDVRDHPKLHLKIARQFLAVAEREYQPKQIIATTEMDDSPAQNWLEHLGFIRGEMVKVWRRPNLLFVRFNAES